MRKTPELSKTQQAEVAIAKNFRSLDQLYSILGELPYGEAQDAKQWVSHAMLALEKSRKALRGQSN